MENKKVVDYYQHFIPQGRSIVPHNNLIKTIIIDSSNRDKTKYPNKFDFTLYLEDTFVDVINIEIIKAYFNYNLPVINNSNNSLYLYIDLNENDDDIFIEFDVLKLGNMYSNTTDEVVEMFNKCVQNKICPKIKNYLTKLAYTNTSSNDIVQVDLPKIFLQYNEKINRFILYKLSTQLDVNTSYFNCFTPYDDTNNLIYNLSDSSFYLFGIDTRIEKKVNDITLYNTDPNITWEDRWVEGEPRTIYIPNPKSSFMKMLGFTNKYAYDCNKFKLNNLDIEVTHTEYLGANMKYEGFRFITRTGDEFVLKYNDDMPRLFLTRSQRSNKPATLPIRWQPSVVSGLPSGQYIDNSTPANASGTSSGYFDLISIADKIYYESVWKYAEYMNNIIAFNLGTPAPGQPEFSFINYEFFESQLPIEIKFSEISPPTSTNLVQLIKFDNSYVSPWENTYPVRFNSLGVLCIKTLNPYNADYTPTLSLNNSVLDIFTFNLFDAAITGATTNQSGNSISYLPEPPKFGQGPPVSFNPGNNYKNEFNLNGKIVDLLNTPPNPPSFNEVETTYQTYSKLNPSFVYNAAIGQSIEFDNKASLIHFMSLGDNEVYQTAKFNINKNKLSDDFLFNQIKEALCANDSNLAMKISFFDPVNDNVLDYTLKLSTINDSVTKTINLDFSGLSNLDTVGNPLYINVGSIYVNMEHDTSNNAPAPFNNNNIGYFSRNVNCSNQLSYDVVKKPGLKCYSINDDDIEIVFSFFSNDLFNRSSQIGVISETVTIYKIREIGIYYDENSDYSSFTNNNIELATLINSSKKIIVPHYILYDFCINSNLNVDTYKQYLLPVINGKCYPHTRYSYNGVKSNSLEPVPVPVTVPGVPAGTGQGYQFDSTISSPFPEYESYYTYDLNNSNLSQMLYFNNTSTGIISNFKSNCMEDFIENITSITDYKYRNSNIEKFTKIFTNDLLITTLDYDSVVISINFFIADSANCLISPDYYLLDIHELNNKYSNNNEIEKHTFLEIPNNNNSLIYYESTNLGYSTKEFNPPLRKLNRLTIKIRDIYGNILDDDDSSKDYTLIMNIQEINNSSNTTINN